VIPWLIVIAGPTASGKSELAVELAHYFNTDIISADSRQFYREMSIGTGKPHSHQLQEVKHHFINSLSIFESYSAGQYEHDCLVLLNNLFSTRPVVIMAGGSGLFIQAVLEGFSPLPEANTQIRQQLSTLALSELQNRLKELDPIYARQVDMHNPRRLIRAIEVCMLTGQPFSRLRNSKPEKRTFNYQILGLEYDREELYKRIDQRIDMMLAQGWEEEARHLFDFRSLPALKTVGYTEWFLHFENKISRDEAIRLIRQHTKGYAKRQLTWFRHQTPIQWFRPEKRWEILPWLRRLSGY
jgi:tRNA dimethylallyltransferase